MNPARLSYHDGVLSWKLGKGSVSAPGTEPESRVALGCVEEFVDAGRGFGWGTGGQAQVAQHLDDHRRVFDGGDERQLTAALRTGGEVDGEDPFE